MEHPDITEQFDDFQDASVKFNDSPTPDHAEELLKAFEALSASGPGGWGAVRRIKRAESVYLADGRRGREDIPL